MMLWLQAQGCHNINFVTPEHVAHRSSVCSTVEAESRRCHMVEQRFALDWDCPSFPAASTHVSLFHGGKDPLHVVASGHGADDANALSDLLEGRLI